MSIHSHSLLSNDWTSLIFSWFSQIFSSKVGIFLIQDYHKSSLSSNQLVVSIVFLSVFLTLSYPSPAKSRDFCSLCPDASCHWSQGAEWPRARTRESPCQVLDHSNHFGGAEPRGAESLELETSFQGTWRGKPRSGAELIIWNPLFNPTLLWDGGKWLVM